MPTSPRFSRNMLGLALSPIPLLALNWITNHAVYFANTSVIIANHCLDLPESQALVDFGVGFISAAL